MESSSTKSDSGPSKMWDIAHYVEAHPDDHNQRWRLVKKLYSAWEYQLALEHLQVLKIHWKQKANVVRYLAATYYRMGRYDEAIAELEEAIAKWPADLGMREQLARVQEVAGRTEAAIETWRRLQEKRSDHPMADSAIRRLRSPHPPDSQEDLRLRDSDSGISLRPGQVCPNCGAQNNEGFDRCWQCYATLAPSASGITSPSGDESEALVLGMEAATFTMTAILLLAALVSLAAFLSVQLLIAWTGTFEDPVVGNLQELYARRLGLTRVLTGVAVLLVSPMALTFAINLVKPRRPLSGALVIISGFLVGAVVYLCTWLAPSGLVLAPLASLLLSFGLCWGALRMPLPRAAGAGALHAVSLLLVGLLSVAILEYAQIGIIFNPFGDIPGIMRYAENEAGTARDEELLLGKGVMPFSVENLHWAGAGSPWLNAHAGNFVFTVDAPGVEEAMRFEIQDPSGTLVYDAFSDSNYSREFQVQPEVSYNVLVHGPEGQPVTITARGLLQPAF